MKADPESNEPEIAVKRHYNKKELCFLFGDISRYYLDRMIENTPGLGEPLGTSYSAKQILLVINHYGIQATFLSNQKKIH